MSAFNRVLDMARAIPRRIVLPEADDERVLEAAAILASQGLAQPVLLGERERITQAMSARSLSTDGIHIVESTVDPHHVDYLTERHAARGMSSDKARNALNDRVTRACVMVAVGDVDGCVAGAATATADVVRNAMRHVGPAAPDTRISSCFLMLMTPAHPVKDAMVIGDCALVIDPDEAQLADIASATGDTARDLLGLTPEVAMLSFSTAGSARHAAVSKVANATELARKQRPGRRIVGEVQLDAAVLPELLARKDPSQASDHPCNVLVFPDLDAGNIGYKLIERFGGAQAIGPVLQGLSRPVNDLSRGCSADDIVAIAAVTAAQVRS